MSVSVPMKIGGENVTNVPTKQKFNLINWLVYKYQREGSPEYKSNNWNKITNYIICVPILNFLKRIKNSPQILQKCLKIFQKSCKNANFPLKIKGSKLSSQALKTKRIKSKTCQMKNSKKISDS